MLFVPRFSAKVVPSPAAEVASFLAHLAFLVLALRERRIVRHRSLMPGIHRFYSNRVPAAVAQKVAITLSLASKTLTIECVINSSPLAPSSNEDVTFCDPIKTPLEL
jgi:hypothetical protein